MGKSFEKEKKRILSKSELKRKAAFEVLRDNMVKEGYVPKDLTMGLVYANVMALIFGTLILFVLGSFFLIYSPAEGWELNIKIYLIWLISYIVLIPVHELIHGIFWAIFAKTHWKSISCGFIKEYMTPYCSCAEALDRKGYVIGALMPTILLGILPCVIAIFNGSFVLFLVGIIMIYSGGGDLTIIFNLLSDREKAKEKLYVDHPCQAGCVCFMKK